jgi:hypothetical protein
MSRLSELLRRLIAADPKARTSWRLLRERPAPTRQFSARLRAQLEPRWTAATRPKALWLRVFALLAAGLVLLAIAAVMAGS